MRLRRALAASIVAVGLGWLALLAQAWRAAALVTPGPTIQLRDRHGAFLGEVAPQEALGYWPIDEVPPRVAAATLALEDRRFATHPGVDPLAIGRAVRQNVRSGDRVSGASTIAMQVARLQGGPGPRTWGRKAFEALTALLLVDRHGRDAVLRQYLTLAPYGNNVYGIAYAARRYFDKPVDDLSWAETALLCAVPQAPGASDLYDPAGRARATARAERILARLAERGDLDEVAHASAVRELHAVIPLVRPVRPTSTLHAVLALGRELPPSTPIVTTSLDLELQGRVQRVLHDAVDAWQGRGAGNAAAVVVELDTLEVLVDVGSVAYHDGEHAGAIDFSRTRRYPGSTLKPFLYGLALERGILDPGTVLDDLARGPEGIGNADGRFLGPMLPRNALATSRNVPALDLARRVGVDELYALFARLGLHDDALPASHYGIGVAIGGMPTTAVSLATAWAALATDGRLRPLVWTADAGPRPAGAPLFEPSTARWLAIALSDPMARLPVFPRMGHGELPFPAAFKTGTSPDFRDAWAVAFTDRALVVVWVGHPDWRPMAGLSGYNAASPLAREILLLLHPERAHGLYDGAFPAPEGWVAAQVCPLSGRLAGPSCSGTHREWFPPDRAPVEPCTAHRVEDGRVVVDLAPRYAAWQRAAGLTAPAGREQLGADGPVRLTVVSPAPEAEVSPDPEAPPGWSTLRLRAAVEPAVDQVVWYVDGEPFAVVEAPYEARWPVTAGRHTFEVGLPFRADRSAPVAVTVF